MDIKYLGEYMANCKVTLDEFRKLEENKIVSIIMEFKDSFVALEVKDAIQYLEEK